MKDLISVLIVLCIVLCILCYKWRWLANSFLIMEAMIRICEVIYPNHLSYNSNPVQTTVMMTAFFALFFVHEASSIIVMTAVLALQILVGDHIIY